MLKSYRSLVSVYREYRIQLIFDVFESSNEYLANLLNEKKVFVVLDKNFNKRMGPKVRKFFRHHRIRHKICQVPEGEKAKREDVADDLASRIIRYKINRNECIVGVGGGAVLDLVGYVAARVHRGIPFINIPTTLLAQVDAGVGVKNAVNFERYKNTLGTFYPPTEVIIDPLFLKTLQKKQIGSGLAEVIKVALMLNWKLFKKMEKYYSDILDLNFNIGSRLNDIIWLAAITHVKYIQTDPFEQDKRRPLVFGHEWGHWLEIKTNYRLSHGEAVSIGIAIDSHVSFQRGLIRKKILLRILTLLKNSGLPIYDVWINKNSKKQLIEFYRGFSKHQDHHFGNNTLIAIPRSKGKVEHTTMIKFVELKRALNYLHKFNID